jgi:hypothetical protein
MLVLEVCFVGCELSFGASCPPLVDYARLVAYFFHPAPNERDIFFHLLGVN